MVKNPKKLALAQETLRNLSHDKTALLTQPQSACGCSNNTCIHSLCFGTCPPPARM